MKARYAIVVASALLLAIGSPAAHAEGAETTTTLGQRTIERGYTITSVDAHFRLAVGPGVLTEPSVVRLTAADEPATSPPVGYVFSSPEYWYDISQTVPTPLSKPVRVSLAVAPTLRKRFLAYFDSRKGVWERVRTSDDGSRLKSEFRFPSLRVAALEKLDSFGVSGMSSSAVVVVESESGRVLGERAARDPRPIASITKLLTALVVLEAGPVWDEIITVRQQDDRPGAKLRVRTGDRLSVRDAFAAMLIGSANNAAVMVARSSGLSAADFVARMNGLANEIGLTAAHFVEPIGLDPRNVASAYDVALLTRAAFSHDDIADMVRRKEYVFSTRTTKRTHRIRTTNALLDRYDGTLEGKTGYLDESGYCLTVRQSRERNGPGVIVVVLGSPRSDARFRDAERLLQAAELMESREADERGIEN